MSQTFLYFNWNFNFFNTSNIDFSGHALDFSMFINSYFLLGALTGLDNNWDGTELILNYYKNDMSLEYSVLFSCITTSGIIGIILMASTLNLMDKQIHDLSRQVTDRNNRKIPMNLVCSEASAHGVWNFWSFVYNEKDPDGTDLAKLFNRDKLETRYIDGVKYDGLLFRPSIGLGKGNFSNYKFPGTEAKINLWEFHNLKYKYNIYSGQPDSKPSLPCVGDTLFLRQYFDRAHIKREDSFILDYESLSDSE